MKQNPKKTAAKTESAQFQPVMNESLLYLILACWISWVLYSYLKFQPLTGFGQFFGLNGGAFSFQKFWPRLGEHLAGIFYALLILCSGYGIGNIFLLALSGAFGREESPSVDGESSVFPLFVGLGFLSLITLLVGTLSLHKGIILIVVAAGSLYGLFQLSKQPFRMPRLGFSEKLALLFIAVIAFFNLTGALTPELFYDSQFYQLGIPNQWINNHKIHTDFFVGASFFPFNINLLYLAALILNSDISAKLLHFFFGIFLTAGVYVFSKKYFGQKTAVFAALIFYSIPQVMIGSWKSAIELGIGMFEFGMVFALINYFSNKKMFWLVIAGILSGFGLGSKYTSIVFGFFPALAMIVIGSLIEKEKPVEILRRLAIFCACAFVISAPWYLRNFVETGNPVFTFFWDKIGFAKMRIAGNVFADPPFPKLTFYNYALFLWPLTMGTLQQESFLGVFFLTFIPLVFFYKKIDIKIKLLFVYFVFSLVSWAVLARFYIRYFIPTLPVACVIMSYYLFNSPLSRLVKKLVVLVVFFIAFINLAIANNMLVLMHDPWPYFTGAVSRTDYLTTMRPGYPNPYYQAVAYANENLPKGSRILFQGEARGLFCKVPYVFGGVSDMNPLIEWVKTVKSPDELRELFRKKGITHILLNVPEARRGVSFDMFYWDADSLKIFYGFWNKYAREIYRGIADISLPQRGIFSMKEQEPEWWTGYISEPANYVYLYEIMDDARASKPHEAPRDFFVEKIIYNDERWAKLEPFTAQLKKHHD